MGTQLILEHIEWIWVITTRPVHPSGVLHKVCLHTCSCVTSPWVSLGPPHSASFFFFNLQTHPLYLYTGPLPVHSAAGPKCHCLELGLLITSLLHDFHCNTYKPTPVFPGCRGVRKILLQLVWSLLKLLHSFINFVECVHGYGPCLEFNVISRLNFLL